MYNFQDELQNLGMDQFQVGELVPVNPYSEDARQFGAAGFRCGGGWRCGGFHRCGFRCFSCFIFHCFNCFHCSNCFRCHNCHNCWGS